MVKIGLAIIVGLIGVALAYPVAENSTESDETHRQVTGRQGGILALLGTALVPVVGAILGPILTNLANGLSTAFNSVLNPTSSKAPNALLIRIPEDSPLYASLAHGNLIPDALDGLPAVGPPSATPAGKTPYNHPAKLAATYGSFAHQEEPAPANVVEPISTHDADVPEPPASPPVKRIPQRKRPEIDYL